MKKFEIPKRYRSSFITQIKNFRQDDDPRKNNYLPTLLDFGPVRFYLARHFGFCYGVENAIEIAYKTVEENSGKKIYLLSEMIHNPGVNNDLKELGVSFIMDEAGEMLIDWNDLNSDDIVIIPAFGTTLEIEKELNRLGIDPYKFNTTCPFVEKVWNRSNQLGEKDYTIIIHGKHNHEETRATFSHAEQTAPSVIVRNIKETKMLSSIILGEIDENKFYEFFEGRYSTNFSVKDDLQRVGVVNQTTMLSSETEEIADNLKETMMKKYGKENLTNHFSDTRDTLCYATNDNQEATYNLLKVPADFAIVVGGYNSSNTSHIVELCEEKVDTFYISSEEKIISNKEISHYDMKLGKEIITKDYLAKDQLVNILLTSGASCPDAVVEAVLRKILFFFDGIKDFQQVVNKALEK
ncbi:MAG: 4-hydroxy-3-methylbut-2-enyl diphosphate reductase [Ignavibacteriae bacterium]|nr:MAG: 4-hydroxy-3-methylbut-2-enyl diphosphate reductase [Ignavibacteriota bacterium]